QDQRGDHLGTVALERLEGLEEVQAGAGDDAGGARVRLLHRLRVVRGLRRTLQLAVRRAGRVRRDRVDPGGEAVPAGVRADLGGDVKQGPWGRARAPRSSFGLVPPLICAFAVDRPPMMGLFVIHNACYGGPNQTWPLRRAPT